MENFQANLMGGLSVAWANIVAFVPRFLVFLVILVGGYFLAKFIAKLFNRLLERLRFDSVVERGGVKRVLAKSGYDASDILAKLLFYALFLFVLQFAFGIFGPNPISDLLTAIISYIPNIFVAAIIIVVASAIAKGVKDILSVSLGGVSYGRFLAKAAAIAIMVIGVFAALDQLNIAPNIVQGLFYAALAVVVGSAIVAIVGGGIRPMQARWERVLGRVESETPRLQHAGPSMAEATRQEVQAASARAQQWSNEGASERAKSAEFRPHDNV